jgi:hypothetical protein
MAEAVDQRLTGLGTLLLTSSDGGAVPSPGSALWGSGSGGED